MGCPETILSGRGSQFTSDMSWSGLCESAVAVLPSDLEDDCVQLPTDPSESGETVQDNSIFPEFVVILGK